eukprot:4936989-Pleurochrysis_carterae.AAC.1
MGQKPNASGSLRTASGSDMLRSSRANAILGAESCTHACNEALLHECARYRPHARVTQRSPGRASCAGRRDRCSAAARRGRRPALARA